MQVPVLGEHLPIKSYTWADGLGYGEIKRIVRDSKGFLWFCTQTGLSRFDGYRFVTQGVLSGGIPFPSPNDILETNGIHWVATNGKGVWRVDPPASSSSKLLLSGWGKTARSQPQYVVYPVGDEPATDRVNVLYHDPAGPIWAGTDAGLFRLDDLQSVTGFHRVPLGLTEHPDRVVQVWGIVRDRNGSLWVATKFGLVRLLADGRTIHYSIQPSQGSDTVSSLLLDQQGRLWVGHQAGLIVFVPRANPISNDPELPPRNPHAVDLLSSRPAVFPTAPGASQWYTTGSSAERDSASVLYQAANGHIWLGTWNHGVIEFDGGRFWSYSAAQGLKRHHIESLGEDAGGNLWIGAGGAQRLAHNGFVSYDASDGLGSSFVTSIFEDSAGDLYVVGDGRISWFNGQRFASIGPNLPKRTLKFGARRFGSVLKDHLGDWWITTGGALWRFAHVDRFEQLADESPGSYTPRDGLPQNDPWILFEDSRGDIWISYFIPQHAVVTRWERATGRFVSYGPEAGLPLSNAAKAFREDKAGGVWILFRESGLARFREGRLQVFGAADGVPPQPYASYVDPSGRLWVASNGSGLSCLDQPAAEHPSFRRYTVRDGLTSDYTYGLTGDSAGRIYVATLSGIDRLDPSTGAIERYRASDGLPGVNGLTAYCDRSGALWVGSDAGLARRLQRPERITTPPAIGIAAVRVGERRLPISDFAINRSVVIELGSGQRQVSIDYLGLSFAIGDPLRFQYKLEGADTDWSAPTEERTLSYANLAPGSYRFLVRALNSSGQVSPEPASVEFAVLAPVWRRWWFITLSVLSLAAAVYGIHRYQLGQALVLERMRTRIATDLHDDIGSSLSQIAIMSELAKRGGNGAAVTDIANLSRDLVDAMGEIVWAINPRHDHVSNLLHRMRRFAADILEARDIAMDFRTVGLERDLRATAEVRRQVFLIFKEAIANIARHAQARRVDITMELVGGTLKLSLRDDGRGFDTDAVRDGNGLLNMCARARGIGGTLEVVSRPGRGTTLVLTVALAARMSVPG
jgi:signal transduction histidine kinase/ligand-binding sensor domain-containing protein